MSDQTSTIQASTVTLADFGKSLANSGVKGREITREKGALARYFKNKAKFAEALQSTRCSVVNCEAPWFRCPHLQLDAAVFDREELVKLVYLTHIGQVDGVRQSNMGASLRVVGNSQL